MGFIGMTADAKVDEQDVVMVAQRRPLPMDQRYRLAQLLMVDMTGDDVDQQFTDLSRVGGDDAWFIHVLQWLDARYPPTSQHGIRYGCNGPMSLSHPPTGYWMLMAQRIRYLFDVPQGFDLVSYRRANVWTEPRSVQACLESVPSRLVAPVARERYDWLLPRFHFQTQQVHCEWRLIAAACAGHLFVKRRLDKDDNVAHVFHGMRHLVPDQLRRVGDFLTDHDIQRLRLMSEFGQRVRWRWRKFGHVADCPAMPYQVSRRIAACVRLAVRLGRYRGKTAWQIVQALSYGCGWLDEWVATHSDDWVDEDNQRHTGDVYHPQMSFLQEIRRIVDLRGLTSLDGLPPLSEIVSNECRMYLRHASRYATGFITASLPTEQCRALSSAQWAKMMTLLYDAITPDADKKKASVKTLRMYHLTAGCTSLAQPTQRVRDACSTLRVECLLTDRRPRWTLCTAGLRNIDCAGKVKTYDDDEFHLDKQMRVVFFSTRDADVAFFVQPAIVYVQGRLRASDMCPLVQVLLDVYTGKLPKRLYELWLKMVGANTRLAQNCRNLQPPFRDRWDLVFVSPP
jgi:hypothetical protein